MGEGPPHMTQLAIDFTAPLRVRRYPQPGTQNRAILDALLRGAKLTPMDALRLCGSNRLGARIYELKRMGWDIQSTLVSIGRAHVAQYSL